MPLSPITEVMRAKTIGELIPTSVASAAAPTTSADERVKAAEEKMAKALAEKDAALADLTEHAEQLQVQVSAATVASASSRSQEQPAMTGAHARGEAVATSPPPTPAGAPPVGRSNCRLFW